MLSTSRQEGVKLFSLYVKGKSPQFTSSICRIYAFSDREGENYPQLSRKLSTLDQSANEKGKGSNYYLPNKINN